MSIFGGRSVSFVVPGKVEGQPRPRATVVNGKPHIHMPYCVWRARVGHAWIDLGVPSFEGVPIILVVKTHRRKPKGTGKAPQVDVYKPDLDNIVKAVLDGLVEAGAFNDDNQVIGISALKYDRVAMDADEDEWTEIEIHEWVTTLEDKCIAML